MSKSAADTRTHSLRVRMADSRGMHARPAALLHILRQRVRPGTKLTLVVEGWRHDFAEARGIRPWTLVRLGIHGGDEVLALAEGTDAEAALEAVAHVFAWRSSDNVRDWRYIASLTPRGAEASGALQWETAMDLLPGTQRKEGSA